MSDQDTIIDTHRNNPPAQPQIPIQQCCVVSHIDLDCVVASKAYITAEHRAAEDWDTPGLPSKMQVDYQP